MTTWQAITTTYANLNARRDTSVPIAFKKYLVFLQYFEIAYSNKKFRTYYFIAKQKILKFLLYRRM